MKSLNKALFIQHAFLLLTISILFTGCATVPYQYGQNIECENTYKLPPGEPQFERGSPNRFLDASGWIWPDSLLSKLMLWDRKVDNHHISEKTEDMLRQYLTKNGLHNVKVRINQYRPGGEWCRTFRNKAISAGWRYTLGFLSWLGYTALPQRFFGGDNYNPYSNTINIYSDLPAVATHEGGHSKDFAKRTYKGTYAVLYMLPFVSLYQEAKATNDALGYLRANADIQEQKNAYKILYPAYATYMGGGSNGAYILDDFYYSVVIVGVISGHIFGRIKASQIHEDSEIN